MATPFNPFKNSFQSAYLDLTDEDPNSVFLSSGLRGQGSKGRPEIADILSNPIDPNYNADFGPTNLLAGLPKLEGFRASTQNYLSGIFSPPTSSTLSQESSTPLGNRSAQNSAQSAIKEQSNLQKAFEGVQSLYSPMGGRPIAGSEDVKVKVDAYGRPYTVVSMTPTDAQGKSQKAETLSFGISPELKSSSRPAMGAPQGQIAAGTAPKFGDKEVFNPFAQQNEAQMQEYNRRKQNSMS